MDAAKALKFSRLGSILLLMTAAVSAQSLTVSPSTLSLDSCTRNLPVTVTTVPAGASYTVTSNQSWLGVLGNSLPLNTAQTSLTVGVVYLGGSFPNGTLTFQVPGGGSATVAATFATTCNGGGGDTGGTVTLSPSTQSLGTATSGSLTATNTSSSDVSYTASTNATWLSVTSSGTIPKNNGTATLYLTANPSGLTTGDHTATVSVTAGGSTSTAQVTISVVAGVSNLTVNGSSTLAVNWSYNTETGTLPDIMLCTVQSSAAASSFSWQVTSGDWLAGTYGWASGANSIGGANNLQLTPLAAMSNLGTGKYTGTIKLTGSDGSTATITVTLTVNGGAISTVAITPTSYTFTSAAGGAAQQKDFTVVASGGTTLQTPTSPVADTWLTIATTGNPWTEQIRVTVNPTSPTVLTDGTYTSTITVPSTAGNSSIPITLKIGTGGNGGNGGGTLSGVAPGSLSFAYQAGTSTGNPRVQYIAVSGSAATFNASVDQSCQSWLSLTPSSGTAPGTIGVYINPSGLTAKTYTCNVTIGSSGNSAVVPVTLLVTAAGGTPVLNLFNQSDAVFTSPNGNTGPLSMVLIASDGSTPAATITLSTDTAWLSAQLAGQNLSISATPGSLATGTYSGTVTITAAGYANSPMIVPVVLVVNGGGTSGNLTFSALNTFSVTGNGAPSSQTLTVSAPSGTTTYTVTAATASGGNWLSTNAAGTLTGNQNVVVTVNPSNLTAGATYTGTLTFTTSSGSQTVNVNVNVTGTAAATIGVTNTSGAAVSSVALSYQPGGAIPTQELVVSSAQGVAPISVALSVSPSTATWLKATFTGGATLAMTQAHFTVTIDPAGLTSGSYSGNVLLTPATGAVVTIPVSLVVSAAGVTITPSTISFSYQVGQNVPAAQNITVSSGGTSMNFTATATTTSGGNWLSVNSGSGATGTSGTTVAVKVDPAGLNAGNYSGTVTVAGTSGASQTVNVTLVVTAPLPTISRVLNAASFANGPIAPGEIVAIFAPEGGANPIGPATAAVLTNDLIVNGKLPTTLGGVQVLFNGYPAPLSYAGSGQINAVVPYEVAGVLSPTVWVKFLGQTSNTLALTAADAAPAIFTANRQGSGPGAILNSDLTYNAPNNAAAKGSTVAFYITGEGMTSPAGTTGQITNLISTNPARTPQPLLPLGVTIDGQPVQVAFFGEAPGYVAGLMQLNVVVPANARTGDLPLAVNIGGKSTQASVTISVK